MSASTCTCNTCEKCEDKQFRDWICRHPFPSYAEMRKKMKEVFHENYYIIHNAEYGEYNHNALKIIYNSFIDKEVCVKVGNNLYNRGGLQALQSNCTVFKYCTPLSEAPFPINTLSSMLEWNWDKIGGFRA
jgi:hypothetical protein